MGEGREGGKSGLGANAATRMARGAKTKRPRGRSLSTALLKGPLS
jgi:hypothetical protein